ncbi:MAG: hypothetical protein SGBAC_012609 [Bacillariaceae sp.]
MTDKDDKFKNADELKSWLITKGVDADDEEEESASQKLYSKKYNRPSKLDGISSDALRRAGLSDPLAQHISNKLDKHRRSAPTKRNILGAETIEKLKSAVFYFVDKARKPIGTGFFVSPNIAISAAHTFTDSTNIGSQRTGYFGKPYSGKTCSLVVDFIDKPNDFVVFKIQEGAEDSSEYLDSAVEIPEISDECFMVAYQIGIHEEVKEMGKELSVGAFQGTVVKTHGRHFVYSCPSFAGDSGGAIIFSGGQVFGMHIETVNQALERRRLGSLDEKAATTEELAQHVASVEQSIDSLIASLSSGAIGITINEIMAAYRESSTKKRRGP